MLGCSVGLALGGSVGFIVSVLVGLALGLFEVSSEGLVLSSRSETKEEGLVVGLSKLGLDGFDDVDGAVVGVEKSDKCGID